MLAPWLMENVPEAGSGMKFIVMPACGTRESGSGRNFYTMNIFFFD
jgi:hypothetical protein